MYNRDALVRDFVARGLLAAQPDRRTFTHAELGDDDLVAGLKSLQQVVDEAKVTMGLIAGGRQPADSLAALGGSAKAQQEEEDRKVAERLQALERGEYTTSPAIQRDSPFKRDILLPRDIFKMNRSTGGKPPRSHVRAKQQYASKFKCVRDTLKGPTSSQPKGEKRAPPVERPGVLVCHRDLETIWEAEDETLEDTEREDVPQTIIKDIIITPMDGVDLRRDPDLYKLIHGRTIVGARSWDMSEAKWKLVDDDFILTDSTQTLVIVRHTWTAPCPDFGRHLCTNEMNAPDTGEDRALAKRAAKETWKEAMARPQVDGHVWLLLYSEDAQPAQAWHVALGAGDTLSLDDHHDVMKAVRR
ncbi:hypothetical protein K466DRAFT_571299, partial [Polyporus arcularius HHB13444]